MSRLLAVLLVLTAACAKGVTEPAAVTPPPTTPKASLLSLRLVAPPSLTAAASSITDSAVTSSHNTTLNIVASLVQSNPGSFVLGLAKGDSVQLVVTSFPVPDSSLAPLGTWIQWSSGNGNGVYVSTDGLVISSGDSATITAALKPLIPGGYPTCDPTFSRSCPDAVFNPPIRATVKVYTLAPVTPPDTTKTDTTVTPPPPDTVVVPPTIVSVASVTVTPEFPTVQVGDSVLLTAVLKDADGNVLTNRKVEWGNYASDIAGQLTVGPAVWFEGRAPGTAAVIATSETQVGRATITVIATTPKLGSYLNFGFTTTPADTVVAGASPSNVWITGTLANTQATPLTIGVHVGSSCPRVKLNVDLTNAPAGSWIEWKVSGQDGWLLVAVTTDGTFYQPGACGGWSWATVTAELKPDVNNPTASFPTPIKTTVRFYSIWP